MSDELLDFAIPEKEETFIKVIGVGGGGGNAVNFMYSQNIHNVDFIVCNTDVQDFKKSQVATKLQLGGELTGGHGAGSDAEMGEKAALESTEEIRNALGENTRMVFITAGMGGGTGTGAAPVVAKIARDLEILTVGVVTLPFRFEGTPRMKQAIAGIEKLSEHVDSLLIINNNALREKFGDLKMSEAFSQADSILTTAVKGTVEIMTKPGQQNVDFNDVKKVLKDSGVAIMTSGTAEGEDRAYNAVKEALNNPLLNKADIKGAKNALVNISYGNGEFEATMSEVEAINEYIQEAAGNDVDLKFGSVIDESLEGEIKVTLVATGFDVKDIPDFKDIKVKPTPNGTTTDNNEGNSGEVNYTAVRDGDMSDFKNTPPGNRERRITFNATTQTMQHSDVQSHNENNDFAQTITLLNTDNQFAQAAQKQVQTQGFDYEQIRRGADISTLESTPAYMRKQQSAPSTNEVPLPQNEMHSINQSEPTVSRITLSENADGIHFDKNKYIHRNVD